MDISSSALAIYFNKCSLYDSLLAKSCCLAICLTPSPSNRDRIKPFLRNDATRFGNLALYNSSETATFTKSSYVGLIHNPFIDTAISDYFIKDQTYNNNNNNVLIQLLGYNLCIFIIA